MKLFDGLRRRRKVRAAEQAVIAAALDWRAAHKGRAATWQENLLLVHALDVAVLRGVEKPPKIGFLEFLDKLRPETPEQSVLDTAKRGLPPLREEDCDDGAGPWGNISAAVQRMSALERLLTDIREDALQIALGNFFVHSPMRVQVLNRTILVDLPPSAFPHVELPQPAGLGVYSSWIFREDWSGESSAAKALLRIFSNIMVLVAQEAAWLAKPAAPKEPQP